MWNIQDSMFHIGKASCKFSWVKYRDFHTSSVKITFIYKIENSILLVGKLMPSLSNVKYIAFHVSRRKVGTQIFKWEIWKIPYFMFQNVTMFIPSSMWDTRISYFLEKSLCLAFQMPKVKSIFHVEETDAQIFICEIQRIEYFMSENHDPDFPKCNIEEKEKKSHYFMNSIPAKIFFCEI